MLRPSSCWALSMVLVLCTRLLMADGFILSKAVYRRISTRLRSTTAALEDVLSQSVNELPLQQVYDFEKKGHSVVRGLLTPADMEGWREKWLNAFKEEELEAYRHEVRVWFGDIAYHECTTMQKCRRILADKDEHEVTPFLQIFNLWKRHESLKPFSLSKRFGGVAAQLLGVPRVRLYQDSMFIKRPGDGPTLWHPDFATAPFDSNDMVTAWISLTHVPSPEAGGSPLCFATGSHRDMSSFYWWNPHTADDDMLTGRYEIHNYGAMQPGDATFHHGWCLHSSAANTLDEPRVAVSLVFVADGARTLPDESEYGPDEEDIISYEDWLKDVTPGEPVDHPLVPVVFP